MKPHPESGNVIFFILLAIALIGIITAALRSGGMEGQNADRESLIINVSQVKQYAGQLERAVSFVLQNGASESEIRFAYPDAPSDYGDITENPTFQVFSRSGGGAEYRPAPSDVNDGSPWEFYGHTHFPEVGSSRSELIAVLPNVDEDFCTKLNAELGYTGQPADTGLVPDGCVNSGANFRFSSAAQFSAIPNTTDEPTFSVKPALEGCVICDDGNRHFYHVLMVR